MRTTEAVIIGAGPHGLSVSAHLRERGTDHVVVGRPMDTWRAHMPVGMCLKSEPYASSIATPAGGNDLAAYCASAGTRYEPRGTPRSGPLTLRLFLGYADWFTRRLVPDVAELTVTAVTPVDGAFHVAFDAAEPVTARQVVVATGVLPYAHLPAVLSALPSSLVTHSGDHADLSVFGGSRVVVVGAGQSALESAALLHETGADVRLVVRGPSLSWVDPNPEHLGPIGRVRRPATRLCEGWRCAFWNTPAAFRCLPESMRVTKARTVLGPSGSWWLRDRVEGKVDVLAGRRVATAVPHDGGVRLVLDDGGVLDADHVICGTGFRIDLSRLPFLSDTLLSSITTVAGYPVVSRRGESSVPGLYFAGAPTAASLGPSARFIGGTHRVAALMASSIARRGRLAAPDRDSEKALVV